MVAAMKLVLAPNPISSRQAIRLIFGSEFPNLHRTLGNMYQKKFHESIGLAKKLSPKVREERCKQLDDEWIVPSKPGNPNWKPYLTQDEEKLIVEFLRTCNFMHMPFNRVGFKVSATCMYACIFTHTCLPCSFTHTQHTHMYTTHTDIYIIPTQGLVCSIARANGRHDNPVASNFYVRSFLKRNPGLTEVKTSIAGHHRAKQATAEVRDAVFDKMQVLYLYMHPHSS